MNINNGKTGNVNIPGALHSTGGDGDGQIGGVVAYAGDVYDETLGKNQKEINQTLLDGSGDSNVIAVALNDLNEKVEEQEKVTSSGLNDLNDKTDNLNKDIEDLEKTTSSSLNDLKDKVDNLNDEVDDNEKVTSISLNDLNEKINNLNDNELVTEFALADLDEKTDVNEKAVSAALNDLNNKISDLPLTPIKGYIGSFKNVPKEDSNVVEADEAIALGVGVYGDKQRSFGWGSGYQTLWLTGSNSQYTVRMGNPSAVSEDKQPLEALATAWIGGYILTSGTTHTRVAKVTAANFTNGVLTITTDTDLGTLNDTKYTYESKTGQQNFCAGGFINSGRQNIAIGTSNFVASSFSITIGTMNGSTTNAKWSITIGEWNNNDGNGGTIVGLDNTLKTTAGSILGTYNSITSNSNVPSSILGYRNSIPSGYGILIGNGNISSGNMSYAIGEHNNLQYSGVALGYYNKDYTSNNNSEKNLFVVGNGTADNARSNSLEQKVNGDLYIKGIGNFTGINSNDTSVKPLNTIISELQNTISDIQNNSSLPSSSPSPSSGYITHTEGEGYALSDNNNISSGGYGSFAEGYQTTASGMSSHSEGQETTAEGENSHSEGEYTHAVAEASHAEGMGTSAEGDYSHAEGEGTETNNTGEHASGRYNKSTLNLTQFSVGIGGDSIHPENAFEIDVNGNVYIKGIGTYNGTNIGVNGVKSVLEVIADLTQQIAALSNN